MSLASIALLVALAASILPFASTLTVPTGYKSISTDELSSLAATSNFVIASQQFGTALNVQGDTTGDGDAVILYSNAFDGSLNQQWILNNVAGSPNQYTIESAQAATFLSFPGAESSTTSSNAQTVIDTTYYPTFTIQQISPFQNGYTFGNILTAWAQYAEDGSVGLGAPEELSALEEEGSVLSLEGEGE
ncbi:hypothetical protein DFH07DRAFT_943376 [Mycena maculata]|uniref:Ricin B lectin domain-containing protein n=1 Tax=Mycena maculata TaxID=230809 RepID=A0AAD7II33_9AGAR|nr:hypothetical protein DFH07DRAFT_943376 [Mycena maculata]